ncbi:MAG: hypothetical protein IPJ76_12535 [Flavobacteriales bacterium]|nr:MAG: hypothetical protein IPJ76_12535 [Flavobacteriales bacterium]
MEQPVYRRSANGRNFYRILSGTAFTEVQLIGSRSIVHDVVAATYPERVLIADMVAMTDGHFLPCTPAEFDEAMGRSGGSDLFRPADNR